MINKIKKILRAPDLYLFKVKVRVISLINNFCRIKFYREISVLGGNMLIIKKKARIKKCRFIIRGNKNNKIVINENCRLKGVTFWIEDDNNVIEIGAGTTVEGKTQLAACEGTKITIGEDCMFSHDIYVRTTDSHPIIDSSEHRTNPAKDIVIGNHVWIGMQALILKGSTIGDNSIISARSIVTEGSDSKGNVILGGIPAKKIKEGFCWKRKR